MSTETVYYAALILVIVASIPAAAWLKRVSDEAWREHQRSQVTFTVLVDTSEFVAAMERAVAAFARLDVALRGVGAAFKPEPHRCDDTCTEEH